ncbi:SDR family oxidoreductase [Granulicella sibirica]|uniref:3-oxoacyl-[acyl-carrier protein] reductase n=1 Tax=Granulicella sibirica TaxID=2479048 RepID=A0A4Q0T4R4_9BACT|nr:SDR family oxidoreductase [Granulicella sibirica]RXH57570.1 3-oxoacyl-[acyl-carrier protein] reductase [Granulicella sibirica]
MPDTTTKVALITGANKGIGFEVARQLGKAGFTVLLGARNLDLGRKAAGILESEGIHAQAIELDIINAGTIEAAAKTISTEFKKLDVLVNNAGIILQGDGLPGAASLDAVETTFKTNFLGPVAVTQAMLPLLREAPAARIVNVSSGLGSISQNNDPNWPYAQVKYLGYNGSKAALNMFTVHLAWELRDTNIKVNSADPGYTATDLNQNRGHQTIEEGAAETVRLALLPPDGPTGSFSDNAGSVPW